MIGFLRGKIAVIDGQVIFLDVNGVGYKVFATTAVIDKVHTGDETTVYTYTHVREDLLELYGFATHSDLKLFEQLIGVSGIGPKTAIGIFSLGTTSEIISAIQTGSIDFFTGVPRLGKKNAQKLIIELKNKLGGIEEIDIIGKTSDSEDVLVVLKSFGFSEKEAREAIKFAAEEKSTEEKIRVALKYLGK